MNARLASPIVLAALLATSCVPGPAVRDDALNVDPPDRWSAVTDTSGVAAAPLDAWWTAFGDETLPALIDEALERNHDLGAAAARVERAAAEARITRAALAPSVSVGLDGGRQKNNFVTFGNSLPPKTVTTYGVNLSASWEADLWGELRAGARAGVAEFQAARAELGAARLSLAAQTSRAWFASLEAAAQLRLAETSVETFRLTVEQVRHRYEAGVRPALDLRLARSNLAGAESLAAAGRAQLDGALRQLELLLGRYPGAAIAALLVDRELPDTPPAVPSGLPSELIARRPDLVAAERLLAASDERLLAARRALYPKLTLTGRGGTLTTEFSDLLDGDFSTWNLAAGLLQPLFQGGRLRANVTAARASDDERLAAFRGAALRAFAEVETALAAEGHLGDRERHATTTVAELSAARVLAEGRYRRGVGGFLAVLESQTRELDARGQLLSLRRERLDNRVALHLALGGGFSAGPSAREIP